MLIDMLMLDEFLEASHDGGVFSDISEVEVASSISEVIVHHSGENCVSKLVKDPL